MALVFCVCSLIYVGLRAPRELPSGLLVVMKNVLISYLATPYSFMHTYRLQLQSSPTSPAQLVNQKAGGILSTRTLSNSRETSSSRACTAPMAYGSTVSMNLSI